MLGLVAQGDEIAFGKLMQQYANLLASHIFRLTHHREQTEEIVQDVFLKIWQTRESLAEVRNFRTYLYVISRNQAMNALRSLIREKKRQEQWEKTSDHFHDDESIADEERQYSLVEQAIAQLPAQQQKVWLLSRRNGMKYSEIACCMELSEETVKKYIQYANQSIIRYVEDHIGLALLGLVVCLQ